MPTKTKTVKSKTKDKKKDRVAEYYESLDLQTWWEQFNGSCNENGTLKYGTVWSFISAKTKEKWQRTFLWWILGPKGESDSDFSKYKQFDWEERRKNGHWANTENADKLQREVRAHHNALDSLREVGKVNLRFISRLESLADEIDREYSGRIFLPSLSAKENMMRAKMYTGLLNELMSMQKEAQIMFGRTQGMDMEKLDQFFDMFGKGMGQAAVQIGLTRHKVIEAEVDQSKSVMGKIMDMVLNKAAHQGLDLPDPEMEDVIKSGMKPTLVGRPQ